MTETTLAEIRLPTTALRDDIAFFTKVLGMRMDMISPADDPTVAVFSGHGLRLRLEAGASEPPGTLRILTRDPDGFAGGARLLSAPNGTRIEIESLNPPLVTPETVHSFVVRRLADQAPWVIGRAGMHYRDLIPDRLGGSIIASHIRIPDGGPVPDMVHYHTVGFQLIFCYRGWVDLVYEDQGPPFRLEAGCCVIQPPEIRHRVLFASDNIEVIEIGVPAEHITTIDHEMDLPNGPANPDRRFQGQRFVHHKREDARWQPFRLPGFEARDTGIAAGTRGVAGVQVARRTTGPTGWARHDNDILFTFVMDGTMVLDAQGRDPCPLAPGDAFVIPPGMAVRYAEPSDDLELLEVSLPGVFATHSQDLRDAT
jgi:quercetin dioxygenase-like cupin family protein